MGVEINVWMILVAGFVTIGGVWGGVNMFLKAADGLRALFNMPADLNTHIQVQEVLMKEVLETQQLVETRLHMMIRMGAWVIKKNNNGGEFPDFLEEYL